MPPRLAHRAVHYLRDHDVEAEADLCAVPEGRARPSPEGGSCREICLSSPGERAPKTDLSSRGQRCCGGSKLPSIGDVQA